ncbi:MAG TPA: UpxY family transcription antiterminator [Bryobacteraceae bacterium]|jgi:transcription antitermination factor NusG|nr:UpxY family transcription antiterminator [Bryobacteraceae bacterium]
MEWYALIVKPQHEKAVAEQLRYKGLETYLPLYRSRRRWSDRVKTIELPLFSQYVFAQFHYPDRIRVLQTSSVTSIVSFGGAPCPVETSQLDALRAIVGSGLPYSPWPLLHTGQRVRISDGPLRGVEGILAREKSEWRVVINMDLLQRAVAVEVERDLVSPCGALLPFAQPAPGGPGLARV